MIKCVPPPPKNAFLHSQKCVFAFPKMRFCIPKNAFLRSQKCVSAFPKMRFCIPKNAFLHSQKRVSAFPKMRFCVPKNAFLRSQKCVFAFPKMRFCVPKNAFLRSQKCVFAFPKMRFCIPKNAFLRSQKCVSAFLEWGIQAKQCFEVADVDRSKSIDFLEFVHFAYELSMLIPVVPQKSLLAFIHEVFRKFCEPERSPATGSKVIKLPGVKKFFDTCFKASPPNLDALYYTIAEPDGEFPIWKFLRLLVMIFHPNCKYNSYGKKKAVTGDAAKPPTFSFRTIPKTAKSFRGAIQKFDVGQLKYIKMLGKGGNCEAWLCKYDGGGRTPGQF